ncbi:hypothetical protein [Myxococcus vastator]|uniref:hypothetical protein n=1 Tax=Myxococcus vastator TaxID=2709664 RepID=UPI0013D3939E|nr:hypothetical protein [Myxococcus vastator]
MADDLVLPSVEWEPLSLGLEWKFDLPPLDQAPPDGSTYTKVSLSRDPAGQLLGRAQGERTPGAPILNPAQFRAGELVTPLSELICTTPTGTTATLRDVYLGHATSNMAGESTRTLLPQQATIVFGALDKALNTTRTCSIWCLNGSPSDFPFSLRTKRERVTRYERHRQGFPDRVHELDASGFDLDSIELPPPLCGAKPCAFSKGPQELPIDAELLPAVLEFGWEAPSEEPKLADFEHYLSAIGFVIGRRLIPVGLTLFDDQARQRLHVLRNAWSIDLHKEVRRPSKPPTDISAEPLTTLIPKFVARAAEFGLSDALWLVWLSSSVPMEAALPNLATALESVMTAWFRSTKTKSHAKYLDDQTWTSLSEKPLADLGAALGDRNNADRILRRVKGANNFGVNERFERFFEEIELPVGDVELRAIASRNKAAHGGSFTASKYHSLSNTIMAYRTLFSRVVLKLLDWDSNYIDYSSYGFPTRALNDVAGGPEGDGKAAAL